MARKKTDEERALEKEARELARKEKAAARATQKADAAAERKAVRDDSRKRKPQKEDAKARKKATNSARIERANAAVLAATQRAHIVTQARGIVGAALWRRSGAHSVSVENWETASVKLL